LVFIPFVPAMAGKESCSGKMDYPKYIPCSFALLQKEQGFFSVLLTLFQMFVQAGSATC
jgi:hypothetical protein